MHLPPKALVLATLALLTVSLTSVNAESPPPIPANTPLVIEGPGNIEYGTDGEGSPTTVDDRKASLIGQTGPTRQISTTQVSGVSTVPNCQVSRSPINTGESSRQGASGSAGISARSISGGTGTSGLNIQYSVCDTTQSTRKLGLTSFASPSSPNGIVSDVAQSPWFGLIAGVASIAGVLLALYPVQARSIPPSEFRSLLWQKSLYISFGFGLAVFGCVQLYNQWPPPSMPFTLAFAILHGRSDWLRSPETLQMALGTWIWAILLVLGLVLLLVGAMRNPSKSVRKRLLLEYDEISDAEAKAKRRLVGTREVTALSEDERMAYDAMTDYFGSVREVTVDMLTGAAHRGGRTLEAYKTSSGLAAALEDALDLFNKRSRRNREKQMPENQDST